MAKDNPQKPRGRKKEEPEDAFLATVLGIVEWGKRHARALSIAGAALVIAVAAVLYYVNYQQTLEARAATRLTELRQVGQSGNRPLAIRDLESFISRFSGTDAVDEARLILASLQLQEGQAEAAASTIRSLAEPGRPIGTNAAFLLAAAREQQGQGDHAVSTYLEIAEDARFAFERRRALEAAARLRLQQGSPEAAADLLQRLVNDLPDDDPERGYYEMLLAEARAATEASPQSG